MGEAGFRVLLPDLPGELSPPPSPLCTVASLLYVWRGRATATKPACQPCSGARLGGHHEA